MYIVDLFVFRSFPFFSIYAFQMLLTICLTRSSSRPYFCSIPDWVFHFLKFSLVLVNNQFLVSINTFIIFSKYVFCNIRSLILITGFLRRPWIQGQPWKVLEFQKTEKGLELFWKKSGRPWKLWNLSIVKVSTRLGDCVNCHSCCKAGRRTAQTVLLINIMHMLQTSASFFSWVPVGLYAIEWLTGRRAVNSTWIL